MSDTTAPAIPAAAPPAPVVETVPAPAAVEVPPAPAHTELVFKDRFEAITGVRKIEALAADTMRTIVAELEKLAHTGPVHVLVDASNSYDPPYMIRPFHFERV